MASTKLHFLKQLSYVLDVILGLVPRDPYYLKSCKSSLSLDICNTVNIYSAVVDVLFFRQE